MFINDPYAPATVRQPRLQILTNGTPIGGAIEFEVTSNNYYNADTFTAQFALFADPNFGPLWWGDQTEILVDIQASLDGGQSWTSLLIGDVDNVSMHLEKGVVQVDGRDLTARFIDNKTQETFLNKTSSQVVQELAARRGLTADVTPTSTLVGRYYSADHDRISMGEFVRTTTEWNLLCSLAQHEQFDIWVTGTTLHFHPSTPPDSDPYVIIWDNDAPWSNGIDLQCDRSMTLAKDVIVVVRSWNSQQANEITKYSPSGARIASISTGKSQLFSLTVPNLTQQQAQDLANKRREEITRHERKFLFHRPADLTLNARNMVRLQGSGSSWDQAYYIDYVRRRMALEGGFTMDVACKNHSPQSDR